MTDENIAADGNPQKEDDDPEIAAILDLLREADVHLERASQHHEAAKEKLETIQKDVS